MSICKYTEFEAYTEDGTRVLELRVDHDADIVEPYTIKYGAGEELYLADKDMRAVIALLRQALAARKAG